MNDYNVYNLNDALSKGDYTTAATIQKDIFNLNNAITSLDPTAAITKTNLNATQTDLLNKIGSATTAAAKDQIISQVKLNQDFTNLINNNPINLPNVDLTKVPGFENTTTTTSTTPTTPTTPAVAPTSMGAAHETVYGQTPGYDTLPKYPGTDTTTTPTTPATTPTTPSNLTNAILPTSMGAAVKPTVGGFINSAGNAIGNIIGGNIIGGITNDIVNTITGNEPPKPPTLPPKPPAHVDISKLTPVTGGLPANLPGANTGTTTGGLPSTGGTTTGTGTNTSTNPTQTGPGGLPSTNTGTTTTTPPAKVDVSKLKPVTDTAYLHSLGIA
jgi:hypothetical protein